MDKILAMREQMKQTKQMRERRRILEKRTARGRTALSHANPQSTGNSIESTARTVVAPSIIHDPSKEYSIPSVPLTIDVQSTSMGIGLAGSSGPTPALSAPKLKVPTTANFLRHQGFLNTVTLENKIYPEEEWLRVFSESPIIIDSNSDPWVEHTLHAFESSLQIHPSLKSCTYVFRKAPHMIGIDLIQSNDLYQLHHRWLDFHYAHKHRESCPWFRHRCVRRRTEYRAICDCAAEKLFELMLNDMTEFSRPERQRLGYLSRDLLNSMPRHITVLSTEVEPGTIETEITWETSSSKYFKFSFEVSVYSSAYASVAKGKYRFHDETADNDLSSKSNTTSRRRGKDQTVLPTATDHLWREAANCSHSVTFKCPHPTLSPGKRYVVLIRPFEPQSFYSAPFEFEIPLPAPLNVEVKKVDTKIHVTWDFPWSSNVEYQVICESMVDGYRSALHHRSEFINERVYVFEVGQDALSKGFEITVKAKSQDGVESSRSKDVKVAPETTSSSEESENVSELETEDEVRAWLFGKIHAGKAYLVDRYSDQKIQAVLHIHQILRRSGKVYLRVSAYSLIGEETKQTLVAKYTDWDHIGEQSEWEEIPLAGLRFLQPCLIRSPLMENEVERDSSHGAGVKSTKRKAKAEVFFSVEWGMTMNPLELRKLGNRSGNVEVDSRDISRLSNPLRVHNYNCGIGGFTCGFGEAGLNVVLGTEADQDALESWNSNHGDGGGLVIAERIDEFLEKYADRVQSSFMEPPSVIVVSNPPDVRQSGPICCESNKRLVKTMAVAKAPIILSECNFDVETGHNCKCMEILILALMEHEYECRCTKFQAADYGSVQSQERYILLASKIGLPNVPVGKGDSGIERELRVQGFKRGYNVCGSHQVRHIREAIPPPLAKAIASSINEHVNALIGGVEDVRTKDFEMGSRKRKAADEPRPERPSKRGLGDE